MIETALADFADADPTVREQLRSQLSSIAGLRQQVGTASIAMLGKLQGQVSAIVNVAASAAHEAQASAQAGSASPMGMAQFASAARAETNAVMAGMKDFDPHLRFTDARDEEAYRQREAERRAIIAAEQAKGTPEGDLNASGAAVGQMADAAAHGADKSPEFQARWDALTASTAKLRAQLIRDGRDVSKFDTDLRNDLRRIMKAKGLTDAQIDAQFAAHPGNPLEAAKAFVADQNGVIGDKEINDLSRKAATYRDDAQEKAVVTPSSEPASPMVDAMAKFKAAGIMLADTASEQPAHGVATRAMAGPTPLRSL